jgi:uncharacterized protein (TIGR03083 family)
MPSDQSSLTAPRPVIVVDLFPELLAGLLDLLRGLSLADWDRPTACPGWTVTDVALHLLGGEIGNLSRRRDGQVAPSSISGWDELVAYINQWNQAWVQAGRRISSRLLCDLLEFISVQMAEYFRSLDPYAIGAPVSWAGPQPMPVWLDIAREYTERWHHQQHIRDAVGKPGFKEPRYLAPALATFVWALPRALAPTQAEEGTSVTLKISGASSGQWSVVQENREWRLYEGAPDHPNAEVALDEDAAWRLFTRGLDRNRIQDHTVVSGNAALGLRVLDAVSIIA